MKKQKLIYKKINAVKIFLNNNPNSKDMNTNDAENTIVIKKRKIELALEQKDQRKKYASAVVGIDDQAEESDEDSNDEEEEDDTNYIIDDFLVPDAEDDSDDNTSNQDDNESASDDEDDEAELQRLKKRKDDVQLDEEDELLIKEYEANLVTEDIKKNVLNKKDIDENHIGDEILPTVSSKDEDEDSFERDKLVSDTQAKARNRFMYMDDDEDSDMGGFIVQDDDDDDVENAAEENNFDKDSKVSRRHVAVPRVRAGKRDGPSYDQIQEAIDIFGAGYDDFDDDDDNEDGDNDDGLENMKETTSSLNKSTDGILLLSKKDQKRVTKLRGRFERSQLVATFCTERDDDIRRIDKPERLQEVLKGRELPQEPEREQEAKWMAAKLALKMIEDNIYIDNRLSDYEKQEKLAEELVEPILTILRFFQLEQFEVPFIWAYRRDYLHPLMTRAHLWKLFLMEEDWDTMYSTKIRLINQVQALVDAANVVNIDKELEMLNQIQNDAGKYDNSCQSLSLDIELAENELNYAYDSIEDKENPTVNEQESCTSYQNKLDELNSQLNDMKLKLNVLKQNEESITTKALNVSKLNHVEVKETLRLFPADKYMSMIEMSIDDVELKDILQFFRILAYKTEVSGDQSCEHYTGTADINQRDQMKKKSLLRKDEYMRYSKIPKLREFVEIVAVPLHEIGDALRHGYQVDAPATPELTCEIMAGLLVNEVNELKTEQQAIYAAKVIIATELCNEPTIKTMARAVFKRTATISTFPTEKGTTAITPFSKYFGLHYLQRKPLHEFYNVSDRTLFVRLVEAESLGLIIVTIDPLQKSDSDKEEIDCEPYLTKDLKLLFQFIPKILRDQDPFPASRATWDRIRLFTLQHCIEHFLIPNLQKEYHRELIRIGKEAIIEEAANNFSSMLKVGPYIPPYKDSRDRVKDMLLSCPNRSFNATVVSIFVTSGKNEPLCMAYVNKDGVLRAHDYIPPQAMNQKVQRIKQFLIENRPDLIVINSSGGMASRSLSITIEKSILREVEEQIYIIDKSNQNSSNDEDEYKAYKAQVMIITDDLASIFKTSSRCKRLFPELQPAEGAAISLARFAQEPLSEYCSAWMNPNPQEIFGFELLFLNIHPLKHLLHGVQYSLLNALEYRLVDAVCDVGINVNKACSYDHIAPMLAFVGGLGLRKADAMRHDILRNIGFVDSRELLLTSKILGKSVWTNAIGFLRVCNTDSEEKNLDPLESTRIHPECYLSNDFATKICSDALDLEHNSSHHYLNVSKLMASVHRDLEKRIKKHPRWLDLWETGERPIPGVTEYTETIRTSDGIEHSLGIEPNDALFQLELDDYVKELEQMGHGKRKITIEQIKDELRFPALDLRLPLQQISASELFTILTGESDSTLYVGMKLNGTVIEVADSSYRKENSEKYERRQRAVVDTDTGLKGFIGENEVLDEKFNFETMNISDNLHVGMVVQAVVIGIKKDKLSLDLSIKPSLLSQSEAWWLEQRCKQVQARVWWEQQGKNPQRLFDKYFNEQVALQHFTEAENAQNRAAEVVTKQMNSYSLINKIANESDQTNRSFMRVVHHALFANLDYLATEARLRMEGKGAGEVLIRPSSRGSNYLTITWAFQENWFKHIGIEERGKKIGSMGLGSQLYIQEDDITEPFSDLDEIFARYIDPMNEFVSVTVNHKSFLVGSPQEVESVMLEQRRKQPPRIPYFIRFEPNKPGLFTLTWLSLNLKSDQPVKTLRIEVRPYGLKVDRNIFSKPSELIVWFKETQAKATAAQIADSRANAAIPVAPRKSRFTDK